MNENKILATVQGNAITESDIDATIASLGSRGEGYNNPQGRQMILEHAINKKLLVLDAEKNLYEYDNEFKAELAKIKEELLANFAIKKALENISVTDEEVKNEFDKNSDKFKKDESVAASHILVDSEEKAKAAAETLKTEELTNRLNLRSVFVAKPVSFGASVMKK